MDRLKQAMCKHREILAYLFWGVMTTAVSWVSYSIFIIIINAFSDSKNLQILGAPLAVFVSNILSWICAVLFAFVTNKLWVFNSKSFKRSTALPEFIKFISSRIATGVLEMAGVPLLIAVGLDRRILGIEGMLAKVIVSFIVIVLNYILSKLLIFKNRKG